MKLTQNKKAIILFSVLLIISFLLFQNQTKAQQIAFPEAEGFGKNTLGGRGGKVIEVTNLNDNGEGSLRAAIQQTGSRTVVFRVSGTIYLESTLEIKNSYITIAGQTAPGDGITITNYNFKINADNVIVRYIRCRLGDLQVTQSDAMSCNGHKNIIIDHCSFSWSIDETASSYSNTNFTMQWCLISESLYNSKHDKGKHGYGGIWGGSRASFHHNLLAHHTSRNPRFNGARYNSAPWEEIVDFRNNVIYNWGFNSSYGGDPSEIDGIKAKINMVNNYYKPGPATQSSVRYRILDPTPMANYGYSYFYVNGNYVDGSPNATNDNWLYGVQNVTPTQKAQIKSDTPFEYDITTIHTAQQAYDSVLQFVGVILPRRDTIDNRIIWEVKNGTATFGGIYGAKTGIIDTPDDVGGLPNLFSAQAPADTDHDGMPDFWETANGFSPSNPNDRNGDDDDDGYTNLEEYLNSITYYPDFLKQPTHLAAKLAGATEATLSWQDNTKVETGFYVERKTDGDFEMIDTIPANSVTFTDKNLAYNTKYIYRIQSFRDKEVSLYSDTVSVFTIDETSLPQSSSQPNPADSLKNTPIDLVLSWNVGIGSTSHDIYFGTTNPPDFVKNQTASTFNPGVLEAGTTYFWRVDEVNVNGKTTGQVWQFTTRPVLKQTLVGHWHFDTPPAINDSSEYHNTGEALGLTAPVSSWDGVFKRCIVFNGIDQYVRIPHNWVFDFSTGDFTICFWLKHDPAVVDNTKEYRYVAKGSHTADPAKGRTGKRYEVFYTPAKTAFRFAIDDDKTKTQIDVNPANFINNKWVMVTAIRDTKSKKLKLYSNATLAAEIADATGDISQPEDLFFSYTPDFQSFINASLDDVRLYNYALSLNQIDSLYKRSIVTGIKNVQNPDDNLTVYPNPANSVLNIHSDNALPVQSIYLTDISGRIIRCFNEYKTLPATLDVSGITTGFYFVNMKTDTNIFRKKIMLVD